MSSYVYSFNSHTFIFGGTQIVGFGDNDEGVSISYDKELITTSVGVDGDAIVNQGACYSATITIGLHIGSPSNAYLSSKFNEYRSLGLTALPFSHRDSTGNDQHIAPIAFVVKMADAGYGATSRVRQWQLTAPKMVSFLGAGKRLA